jgi:hypothetical protein
MNARDAAPPIFDALANATKAGNDTVVITGMLRDSIINQGAQLLDALDDAKGPHDERYDEATRRLNVIATALLGPGDRDLADIVPAAFAIRDSAGVSHQADINLLLQEIAAGAELYARPEYGPNSRWQNLRDQLTQTRTDLAAAQQATTDAEATVEAIRQDLATEQTHFADLQSQLDSMTLRATRDGLSTVRLQTALKEMTWDDTQQKWLMSDDARTAALDA